MNMFAIEKLVTFFEKKGKKVNKKKSYADRPYLIFLAMLVETKNIFLRLILASNILLAVTHAYFEKEKL